MGRKPKNDHAMTDAQKMREYRQRKKELGQRQISLPFSESELKKIDELVEFFELPNRTVAMQDLLKLPLLEAVEQMMSAKEVPDYKLLTQVRDENDLKTLRDIKKVMWNSITYRSEELSEILVKTLEKHFGATDGR